MNRKPFSSLKTYLPISIYVNFSLHFITLCGLLSKEEEKYMIPLQGFYQVVNREKVAKNDYISIKYNKFVQFNKELSE